MTTFEIKITILSILGEKAEKERAEDLYKWVMQELDLKDKRKDNVTTLKTVQ
jgi:hypothetical protein